MTDINKLTDEQRKMVEDNLALATHIAKKYLSKTDYIKNQDILQEAVLAMIKAVSRFDPSRAKFSTYMYPTLDGHLKRFVGYRDRLIPIPHQKHLKQETQDKAANARTIYSLDKTIKISDNDNDYTLLDILPDNVNLEKNIVDKLCLNDAIKSLEWREKLVIIYRYYFDLNQMHIAKLMWLSQVHVHRIEKKALKNMKTFLTE